MYQLAKLVFKSYMPKHLEKGMLFLTNVGKDLSLVELTRVPQDEDEYLRTNGYPVEPYIVDEGNPNLNDGYVIAQPNMIAWLDEGDHTDELRDLTIKDYHRIMDDHGYIYIDSMDSDDHRIVPNIYEGQVVISFIDDDFDDEEHEDWEETEEDYEYILEGNEEWESDNENDHYEKDEE